MKYVIARAIKGISVNGNEYLLDEKSNPLTFDTKEDAQKYIDDTNISKDGAIVWEVQEDEKLPDLGINVSEHIKSADKMGR